MRHIEGRRSVYEGTAECGAVIVKVYRSAVQGRRHFRRDLRGFERLARRGIPTAAVAAGGRCNEGWALALEKIAGAEDVHTLFEGLSDWGAKQRIGAAIFDLLGRMHEAGVLQRDLHLGNFLWDGQAVYAMDPAQMRFYSKPIHRSRSLRQAAALLGSFLTLGREEKTALLDVYAQRRGWGREVGLTDRLERSARKMVLAAQKKGLRKTLRNSKRFVVLNPDGRRGVFVRSAFEGVALGDFIATVDAAMEAGQILKRGGTCFVSRIDLRGQAIVVKRYNYKGLWHSLRHTIKGSRARKCWLLGHRLCGAGIACARPLGFLEQRRLGLIRQSYILNTFIEGPDLRCFLQAPELSEETKRAVIRHTEALLERLAECGMTHGDPKPSNILIDGTNEPALIDLDSIRHHRLFFTRTLYAGKMKKAFGRRLLEIMPFSV